MHKYIINGVEVLLNEGEIKQTLSEAELMGWSVEYIGEVSVAPDEPSLLQTSRGGGNTVPDFPKDPVPGVNAGSNVVAQDNTESASEDGSSESAKYNAYKIGGAEVSEIEFEGSVYAERPMLKEDMWEIDGTKYYSSELEDSVGNIDSYITSLRRSRKHKIKFHKFEKINREGIAAGNYIDANNNGVKDKGEANTNVVNELDEVVVKAKRPDIIEYNNSLGGKSYISKSALEGLEKNIKDVDIATNLITDKELLSESANQYFDLENLDKRDKNIVKDGRNLTSEVAYKTDKAYDDYLKERLGGRYEDYLEYKSNPEEFGKKLLASGDSSVGAAQDKLKKRNAEIAMRNYSEDEQADMESLINSKVPFQTPEQQQIFWEREKDNLNNQERLIDSGKSFVQELDNQFLITERRTAIENDLKTLQKKYYENPSAKYLYQYIDENASIEDINKYNSIVEDYKILQEEMTTSGILEAANKVNRLQDQFQGSLRDFAKKSEDINNLDIANKALRMDYRNSTRILASFENLIGGGVEGLIGGLGDIAYNIGSSNYISIGPITRIGLSRGKGLSDWALNSAEERADRLARIVPKATAFSDISKGASYGDLILETFSDNAASTALSLLPVGAGLSAAKYGFRGLTGVIARKAAVRAAGNLTSSTFFVSAAGNKYTEVGVLQREAYANMSELKKQMLKPDISVVEKRSLQLQIDRYQNAIDTSTAAKAFSAFTHGLIEFGAEKLGSLKFIESLQDASYLIGAKGFKSYYHVARTVGTGILIENTEEVITQLGQNGVDIVVLGENKSLIDGINPEFFLGTSLTSLAISGPSMGQNLYNIVTDQVKTKTEVLAARALSAEYNELQKDKLDFKTSSAGKQKILKRQREILKEAGYLKALSISKLNALDTKGIEDLFQANTNIKQQQKVLEGAASSGLKPNNPIVIAALDKIEKLNEYRTKLLNTNETQINEYLEGFYETNPADGSKGQKFASTGKGASELLYLETYARFQDQLLRLNVKKGTQIYQATTIEELQKQIDKLPEDRQKEIIKIWEGSTGAVSNGAIIINNKLRTANIAIAALLDEKGGRFAAVVATHELLHLRTQEAGLLKDNDIKLNFKGAVEGLKTILAGKLETSDITEEDYNALIERIDTYDNDERVKNPVEEIINLYHDAVELGMVDLPELSASFGIKSLLNSLGSKFMGESWQFNEFNTAEDVLNYLKRFNQDVRAARLKVGVGEPEDGIKLSITREADKAKTALDNIPYSELQSGVSQSAIGRELPGMVKAQIGRFTLSKQARQNFIDVVVAKMFIEKDTTKWGTDPKGEEMTSKGTLYGFLNGRIGWRIKDVVREEYKRNPGERIYLAGIDTNQFETLDKAANVVDEETAVKEDDKPVFKKLLPSKVISTEALVNIKNKVLSTVRTLKTAIDSKTSINRTVSPLIAEIKKEMGEQADIDLKEEMGGKKDGELQKWLITNKKAILENMTTTWLMGKGKKGKVKGGIPAAIQKRVDGTWTNNWEGKKIDRESVKVDNAGRTSGADMVRRNPNVSSMEDITFLSYFLQDVKIDKAGNIISGDPIRGRKESLAKAMAEEISLEVFNQQLEDKDSNISKAFEQNQTLKGVILADNYIAEVAKQIERGNVKFSISDENLAIFNSNSEQILTKLREANVNMTSTILYNIAKSVLGDTIEDQELKNYTSKIANHVKKYIKTINVESKVDFNNFVFEGLQLDESNSNLYKAFNFTRSQIGSLADLFNSTNVAAQRGLSYAFNVKMVEEQGVEGVIKILKWLSGHQTSSGKIGDGRNQGYAGNKDYIINNLRNIPNIRIEFNPGRAGVNKKGKPTKGKTTITEVYYKGVKIENLKSKITTPSQKAGDNTEKSRTKFIKEYELRKEASLEAWDVLNEYLSFVKENGNKIDWIMAMMSLKSNMSSILKAAAPVKYYYMGSYIGKLRYEHMIPTEYMVLKLTEYYWNGKKFDLSALRDRYNVAIIPVKMDDNFNIQRRSQMRPGYDPMVDSETERYYDKGTLGYDNMYAIESLGGEDKGAIYGESWIKLSKSIDIKALNVVNTQQKAIDNGRSVKMSLSPKKIRVFDFDDTLAITDSKVLYTMPNPNTGFSPESVKQKAIFMVGGPGAGKTNVGKGLQLGRQGYKVVNQDIALEAMKKESGLPGNESDYNEAQRSTRSVLGAAAKKAAVDKFDKYAKNGDGMVIDGTGASYNATMKKVKQLEDSGYEVHMVIANTPLETALARNKARTERSLPSFIVEKTWKQVQESSELYRKDFGDRLYEINTESIEYGKALPGDFLQTVYDGINKNIAGKIDAATFAKEAGTMESLGAEWNFAEFSKIVDGKEGPLLEVAKIIADKRGTKDVFVLTARPSDAAVPIKKFLASMGLDIPIKNITGLGDGSPKAKADWITGKFAEGYNDFYFADDHTGNVKAVKDVLNALDVKSKVQQSRVKFSLSLDKEFNAMIERNKGVRAETTFSDIVAKKRGKDIGRFKLWMPSSLDDFKGLTSYVFSGSGRQGDADMEFFQKALIDPYFSGVGAIETAKQTIKNDFKALNKLFKPTVKKLGDIVPGTSYTYDQAIRVSLWTKAGYEIPGISKRDLASLNDIVSKDPELSTYSDGLLLISKNDKWGEPNDFWDVNTILSDLNNMTEKAGRKTYIAEFVENVDVIFSDKNLNKIEALYGTRQRDALEDAIYRMKNGTNRPSGTNKIVNVWNNWVNNSTGAIMFFNRKSAALQLISTVNFMNWSDNNPLKAAAAFANQPQYWKDWATIFNSDKLKQRRSGLKSDVNEAEIANSAANSTNKAQAALSYLLKIGFTPTQIADSFAIASGGASFYRNRINTYKAEYIADGDKLKRKYTDKEAEEKAWKDFSQVSDETQQSSDPALISMEQASVLGRLVLTFQNTAIQLNRSIKKSSLDLYKRRRTKGLTQFQSDASNLSKVIYYGAIQNIIFTSLQAALFSLIPGFDDDDEEENAAAAEKKVLKGVNSVVDTMLKGGFGLKGAVVSTVKNMVIEYAKQEKKGYTADHTYTILQGANLSPPIGSKLSKIYGAIQTKKFDKDVINDRGFSVTIDGKVNISPSYSVLGSVVSGTINLPLDRAITEVNSLAEAFDARNTAMQRIALGLGWRTWDVGTKNEENDLIKATYKIFRKEEGAAKAKATRAASKAEKDANLSPEERTYNKLEKLKKTQQIDSLEAYGLSKKEIRELPLEKDRINKIISLKGKPKKEAKLEATPKQFSSALSLEEPTSYNNTPKNQVIPEIDLRFKELEKLKKGEQVDSLKTYGLSDKQIKKLKYEEDRVKKIIQLQDKKRRDKKLSNSLK